MNARTKTTHQLKVERFMLGIGRPVPPRPQLPDDPELLAVWGRLMLEELFEYFDSAGIVVTINGSTSPQQPIRFQDLRLQKLPQPGDLVGIVDAAADMQVISTGILSLCGVADVGVLETVDDNNLLKVDPAKGGYIDGLSGKFIKPKDHPKPDFESCLESQGWRRDRR